MNALIIHPMDYDLVVLGGGLSYTGLEILKNKGLKLALVEKDPDHLGGVCLHEGCVPTKLYLAEAQKLLYFKTSRLFEGEVKHIDLKRLKAYKEELSEELRKGILSLLKGADILYGYGELVEPNLVDVEGKKISGRYVWINTGKRQERPPEGYITTDQVFELEDVPDSVLIEGDDPIGYEFACFFNALGSQVFLNLDADLSFMHPSLKIRFEKMLKESGIKIKEKKDDASLKIYAKRRIPNSDCLKVDISKDKYGHVLVDKGYETSLKDHFAIGDVNGLCELAHASRLQAISVAKRLSEGRGFYIPPHKIPYVLYTIPMAYAKVGFTKKDLQETGVEYTEKGITLRPFAVGSMYSAQEASAYLYFDKKGFFLGGEVLFPFAWEVIGFLTSSLFGEFDINLLKRIPLPHPTLVEILNIRLL